MPGVLELADQLWRGERTTTEINPITFTGELAEVLDRTGSQFLARAEARSRP